MAATRRTTGFYVGRGLLAGLAGGLAMAAFLLAVGERSIRDALAIEAAAEHASDGAAVHHEEMFTRDTQVFGGAVAAVLFGVLLGAVFAVVFAAVRHRSRAKDDFQRSLWLGAVGFGTLSLLPALCYPANPPAVGDPDTVGQRTGAYLSLLALGVILAIAAWLGSRALRERGVADHARITLVAVAYVAAVGAGYAIWPDNPDDVALPAQLIWEFRIAAIGGAAALWAGLALAFGWLLRDKPPAPTPVGAQKLTA